jgi:uncharacterized protein
VADSAKPSPEPTPETQPFWDATARSELHLQRCHACDAHYFPPRPFCPTCHTDDVSWTRVSGRGRLHTYMINHRPPPGWRDEAPYVIAIVELEEGPRMMSNVVGVEASPEALELDMELEVTFEDQGGMQVPKFRPAVSSLAEAAEVVA